MFPVPSHWREFEDTRVIETTGCLHARNQKRKCDPFYSSSDFSKFPRSDPSSNYSLPNYFIEFLPIFFFSHLFPTVSIVKSGEKTETLTSHEFQVTSHFVAHNSSSARLIASCFEDIAGHRIMISRVARDSINSLSLSLSLKITFKNVEKQIRNYPKNYSRIDLRRRAERGR